MPLNLAYFFLTLEAELWKAFASIPFILFIYLFYQFARYRARRYRLTRTVWRGVRFWMKGRDGTMPGAPVSGCSLVDRLARAGDTMVGGVA